MEAIREEVATIEIDGFLYDTETGECVGAKTLFEVTDEDSAQWVMQKMHEAKVQADAYAKQANDILDNLKRLQSRHLSKAKWLEACYGEQMKAVAMANLPKGKKTWTCFFGSIASRKVGAKIEIKNQEEAILWAREYAPSAVKVTESLLKSELPPIEEMSKIFKDGSSWMEIVPESESITIKIGA